MRLSALPLLLLSFSALASEPATLTGRVLVQNAGPHTVLAFIETGDAGVTHVLRLSSEEAFPQNPVFREFERAHVEIEPERFVITSAADRTRVILALTRGEARPAPADEDRTLLLRGHWLGQRTIEAGRQSIDAVKRAPVLAALFCDVAVSPDVCEHEH